MHLHLKHVDSRLLIYTHTHTHTISSNTTKRMSERRSGKGAFWLLVSFALLDLCFAGPRPFHRKPQRTSHEPGTRLHNKLVLNDQGQQRIHFPSLSDSGVQRIQIPSLSDLDTQRVEIPLLDDGQVTQFKSFKAWLSCFRVSNGVDLNMLFLGLNCSPKVVCKFGCFQFPSQHRELRFLRYTYR